MRSDAPPVSATVKDIVSIYMYMSNISKPLQDGIDYSKEREREAVV